MQVNCCYIVAMSQSASNRYDTVEISGWKVKEMRRLRRLTQEQLVASLEGVSRGYLSIIERQAKSRVSRTAAMRIAGALGVALQELENEDVTLESPLTAKPGDDDILAAIARALLETAATLADSAQRLRGAAEALQLILHDREE